MEKERLAAQFQKSNRKSILNYQIVEERNKSVEEVRAIIVIRQSSQLMQNPSPGGRPKEARVPRRAHAADRGSEETTRGEESP